MDDSNGTRKRWWRGALVCLACGVLSTSGCASASARSDALTGVDGARAVATTRAAVGEAADAGQALAWKRTSMRTRDLEDWVFARYLERSSWSALGGQRALLARGARDPRLAFNAGVLLEDLGRLADARDTYSEAARLGDADASLNLLGVCEELGDQACVKEHFEALRTRASASHRDALRFARALHWTGSPDARKAYESVAESSGEEDRVATCEAHAGLARIALARGVFEDSARSARAARQAVESPRSVREESQAVESPKADLVIGRGAPVDVEEFSTDAWQMAKRLVNGSVSESDQPFADIEACTVRLSVERVAYLVPLQDQPFNFPTKRLIKELRHRGEAEQRIESILFDAIRLHSKHDTLDLTTPHAAVLVADLYYDFAMALRHLSPPDGLTSAQKKVYEEHIEEYAKRLVEKSVIAYERAFEFEGKLGTGHPAFVRAHERMLKAAPERAPAGYTPGSLVRRGERRVPWKKARVD